MISVDCADQLKDKLASLHHCPLQRSVDEPMLRAFTTISGDNSAIHSPNADKTVVPGNLLISLLPSMLQSGLQVQHMDHCKTVALDKLRFHQSVSLGQTLQLSFKLLQAKTLNKNTFVSTELVLSRAADNVKVLSAVQKDCYINLQIGN